MPFTKLRVAKPVRVSGIEVTITTNFDKKEASASYSAVVTRDDGTVFAMQDNLANAISAEQIKILTDFMLILHQQMTLEMIGPLPTNGG